jgi:hypothetical protein
MTRPRCQSFQFQLFYLYEKTSWYIEIVKFHLLLRQRKVLRTTDLEPIGYLYETYTHINILRFFSPCSDCFFSSRESKYIKTVWRCTYISHNEFYQNIFIFFKCSLVFRKILRSFLFQCPGFKYVFKILHVLVLNLNRFLQTLLTAEYFFKECVSSYKMGIFVEHPTGDGARATSRKVAGSISGGVIGTFHWPNPSGHTMALGSTHPVTEMSTRGMSWESKGGRCMWLTTLPPLCTDCLEILGASTSWSSKGPSRSVMGLLSFYPPGDDTLCRISRNSSPKWIVMNTAVEHYFRFFYEFGLYITENGSRMLTSKIELLRNSLLCSLPI